MTSRGRGRGSRRRGRLGRIARGQLGRGLLIGLSVLIVRVLL